MLVVTVLLRTQYHKRELYYVLTSRDLCLRLLTFLSDKDWEVCLHTLRLLQSVLAVEEEQEAAEGRHSLAASLLDPELRARVSQLTHRGQSSLRLAAQQTLEDLQQVPAP